METRRMVADATLGVLGALAGARAMTPVTTAFYDRQSEESKRHEAEVSDGVAYDVVARKAASLAGIELSEEQERRIGLVFHYGIGVIWAPLYVWLRRSRRVGPLVSALASALTMFVLVDEAGNVLFRVTPAPSAYPLVTHLRGLVGHLAFGLTMAATVEAGWAVVGQRPGAGR